MNVRIFTFSQFHNKIPVAGSTQIRVMSLLPYWPEAALYRYGENPDVLIFQKVYMAQDYQFPAHFQGIKILDMCDPDWMSGQMGVKEMIDNVDAITTSSEGLRKFVSQMTDKPVIHIPDRFDIATLPSPKRHSKDAKTVIWFGYRHNADTLKPAMAMINDLKLNLIVVADDDPLAWQWLPGETGDKFRANKYQYYKFDDDEINKYLQLADFAILPKGNRPVDPFKSNNKTIKAILAGLPVAHDGDDLERFVKADARREYLQEHYENAKKHYNIAESVVQYKHLINRIVEVRNNGDSTRA